MLVCPERMAEFQCPATARRLDVFWNNWSHKMAWDEQVGGRGLEGFADWSGDSGGVGAHWLAGSSPCLWACSRMAL